MLPAGRGSGTLRLSASPPFTLSAGSHSTPDAPVTRPPCTSVFSRSRLNCGRASANALSSRWPAAASGKVIKIDFSAPIA